MQMKYRTLVNTQYLENYGAHSENGKFEDGNSHWKFKGGEQYIVSMPTDRTANAVAFISAYLQKNNNSRYGKELPVSWEPIGADWAPENDWEKPIEIDVEEYFAKKG